MFGWQKPDVSRGRQLKITPWWPCLFLLSLPYKLLRQISGTFYTVWLFCPMQCYKIQIIARSQTCYQNIQTLYMQLVNDRLGMWYLEGVLQKWWNLRKKLEVDDPTVHIVASSTFRRLLFVTICKGIFAFFVTKTMHAFLYRVFQQQWKMMMRHVVAMRQQSSHFL
jgi:hypothetical protein